MQWRAPELILTSFGTLGRVVDCTWPMEGSFTSISFSFTLPSFMVPNPPERPGSGISCIGEALDPLSVSNSIGSDRLVTCRLHISKHWNAAQSCWKDPFVFSRFVGRSRVDEFFLKPETNGGHKENIAFLSCHVRVDSEPDTVKLAVSLQFHAAQHLL